MKKQISNVILLFSFFECFSQGHSFFVDNLKGNDSHNGESSTSAWKSLSKLNDHTFGPGDRIYLKRGQSFDGYIHLKGSGKIGNTIELTSFGTGKRPIINAGNNSSAIELLDGQYWEIENIETTRGKDAGIFIGCTKDGLELNHIRITNCYAHNIGDTSKIKWSFSQLTGGIVVANGMIDKNGQPVFFNSVFNDVVVNDCTVRYNYRWVCFSISSGKKNGKGGSNNYIRNCVAEYSSADGIRMNGVRNSVIEYCAMFKNGAWPNPEGRNLGGLGAWFFDAENSTIQYCEAGFVRGISNDAGAFDIDYWQKNSTVQYCYGHDCAGYGVSVFGADSSFPTENSTVRYNVFENNGRDSLLAYEGDFYVFTWNGGLLNGVNIHDNISYWDPVLPEASLKSEADFTGSNSNVFKNNIIISKSPLLDSFKNVSLQCDSNFYWSTANTPAWQFEKEKFYSLSDWQKATGQDLNSHYLKFADTLPSWYKYPGRTRPFRKNKKDDGVTPGGMAPAVSAYIVHGINRDYIQNGPILLCFVNISDSLETSKTISQLVCIRSMKRQYANKGLRIVLVDESYSGHILTPSALRNFITDHELEDIPVESDNKKINFAAKYGVTALPSLYLISSEGVIKQHWENLALPAQLSFAVKNILSTQ